MPSYLHGLNHRRRPVLAPVLAAMVGVLAFGPLASAEAPSVTFGDDAPEVYVKGSGEPITFELSGPLPENADVLVVAWSPDEQTTVEGFTHRLTAEPWQIEPERLDLLPTGLVHLQLQRRAPGEERSTAVHEIEVRSASPRSPSSPTADEPADPSDTTDVTTITGDTEPESNADTDADTDADAETLSGSGDEQLDEQGGNRQSVPTVSFDADAPRTYDRGSGVPIDFVVDGEMPNNGDVLVMAWSHDERTVVDGFAHVHTSEPWRIDAERLDRLPAGDVQLQLHRRIPGAERTIARHEMHVRTVSDVTVRFSSDTPSTYQQGSGEPIAFIVDGPMFAGDDVLALAWSASEGRMVDEFAQAIENEPWQIAAANLDRLPPGEAQLQLHRRVSGLDRTIARHTIQILPPPPSVAFAPDAPGEYERGSGAAIALSVDGEMPGDGSVRISAASSDSAQVPGFTHELTDAPWRITSDRLDALPEGEFELRAERIIPGFETTTATHALRVTEPVDDEPIEVNVAFADDTPTAYQQGSGQDIAFVVSGEMPEDGDVLSLAWSDSEQRMVDEFAEAHTGEPWRVTASQLDALPAGRVQLQLHRRVPELERTIARHWIEIEPPAIAEPPSIRFASNVPSTYRLGSGETVGFEVEGDLPEGADVLAVAWSDAESRMVDEFAHSYTEGPWHIGAERMSLLPPGDASIQLLLRLPDQSNLHVTHGMTILAAAGDDGDDNDDGGGDDGDDNGGGDDNGDDNGGDDGDDNGGGGGGGDDGGDDNGGDNGDDNGSDNEWVVGGDGWTQFERSADTRVIYVSSSEGNDANDGRSPEQPVRSLTHARTLVRDGYPDWMLLKAGDTWHNQSVGARNGRSAREPALTGVYGEGPRPRIRHGRVASVRGGRSHYAVVGLEFDSPGEHAIHWVTDGHNLLFEDLLIRNARGGFIIDARSANVSDVRIRRCIVVDSYSTGSHSSGMFVNEIHGLLIEENVFDHNGWQPHISGADRTIYNHNMYISHRNTNVVVRGNIVARGSSHGIQMRPGGVVEDNLLLRNPINISIGYQVYSWPAEAKTGVVRRNVVIDSDNIGSERRGIGIWAIKVKDTEIYDNVLAHRVNGSGSIHALDAGWNSDRVTMRDNHIYGWGGSVDINLERHLNLTMKNNYFDATRFSSHYFDTSMVSPNVVYNDPTRSVASYMTDRLGTSRGSIEAFLELVRARPRSAWNEVYTADAVNEYIRAGFAIMPSFD